MLFLLWSCQKNTDPPVAESTVPTLRIITENKQAVTSKHTYLNATLSVENGESFSADIEIRGRGNTTWSFPKKPFKIKLKEKAGLLGLKPEKRWVLLVNYLDPSLLQNAVAMEIGQLLKMPYTNHMKPVNLWLNNEFLGSYTLTEQIEVKENRVNVGDDGLLLSLDTIIEPDDDYFFSSHYQLPVQIKHPEITSQAQIDKISNEFDQLEKRVFAADFPGNDYLKYFDADAMANYLLVYTLTCNEEINHPKSTYLYKTAEGKFHIGPIWDFDWAFSYEQSQVHYVNPNRPLFWNWQAEGTTFFGRIAADPAIKSLYKEKWQTFRRQDFNKLLSFVDEYAAEIKESRREDFKKWGRGNSDFETEKENMKSWLNARAIYIDELVKDY